MKRILIFFAALSVLTDLSAQIAVVRPVLDEYLRIKNALVEGDMIVANAAAIELSRKLVSMDHEPMNTRERRAFLRDRDSLIRSAQLIGKTKNIEGVRSEFELLSMELWSVVLHSEGVGMPLYYTYCPMKKAYWISADPNIRNPYYGSEMLSCGTVEYEKLQ